MIRFIQRWRERRQIKKFITWFNTHYDLSDKRWDDRCACGVAYWERWDGDKTCNCTNSVLIT